MSYQGAGNPTMETIIHAVHHFQNSIFGTPRELFACVATRFDNRLDNLTTQHNKPAHAGFFVPYRTLRTVLSGALDSLYGGSLL
jgi:hypothetical protein